MEALACPICHHHEYKSLYSLDAGKLMTCGTCHIVFFSPMPTPEELKDFYSDGYHDEYSQSTMASLPFDRNRYQLLEGLIDNFHPSLLMKSNRTLLDVGCGVGGFLGVAQQAGWTVTGTELTDDAVEKARGKLGDCVLEGDISNLSFSQTYDLITNYHVIEHLLDPVKMLQTCYRLLSPQGVLFVETPNIKSLGARIRGAKWSHIIPPEHIVYFSPGSIRYALHKAGFDRVIVLTSAPQVIESIQAWPSSLKKLVTFLYSLAPKARMGAAVQAIAFKD